MTDLFQHIGYVTKEDDYKTSVDKIHKGLQSRTDVVVQWNLLSADFPQGTKSFESWSKEISNAAKLINFKGYDWKQAAVDSMILQTLSPKLHERALQDSVNYEDLLKLKIAKEQSKKGAASLEKASGQDPLLMSRTTKEVGCLQLENQKLRSCKLTQSCFCCGSEICTNRQTCPAVGKQCANYSRMNHFAQVCRSKPKEKKWKPRPRQHSDSKESLGRIVIGKLGSSKNTVVKLTFSGTHKFSPTKSISQKYYSKHITACCEWHYTPGSSKNGKCF